MREYIYSLMTDRKKGVFASVIKAILLLISWFYGVASWAVKSAYKIGFFKSQKPDCKIVSIGNISLGGTGKTPTACMLARKLKGQNKSVAVLIRGYGDDEWKMIKESLDPIPVVVGRDRVKNSRYAVSKLGVDTIVLDDGFQHWRIKRDLDIVLIDTCNPFGNGKLFPRGVLRETPAALKRADILMLTKTDMKKGNVDRLKKQLKEIAPDLPVAESVFAPKYLYNLSDKKRLDLSAIKGKSIVSLSSIVNTDYFEFILKNIGADLALKLRYPDHHDYSRKDMKRIIGRCNEAHIDTIVTTEKDAVKLRAWNDGFNILVLYVEPEIAKGEEILNRRLSGLYSG